VLREQGCDCRADRVGDVFDHDCRRGAARNATLDRIRSIARRDPHEDVDVVQGPGVNDDAYSRLVRILGRNGRLVAAARGANRQAERFKRLA
jgi:hypothetical protein